MASILNSILCKP